MPPWRTTSTSSPQKPGARLERTPNSRTTGHREGAHNRAKVKPGDIFVCYVTKTSAIVGAEKVTSDVYEIEHEEDRTWASGLYPVRFKTELIVKVPVEMGIRLDEIRENAEDPALWNWVYRGSLNEVPQHDGDWIMARLAEIEPKLGPEDPEPGEADAPALDQPDDEEIAPRRDTRHAEIQAKLVILGKDLGLDVWVARNDRNVVHGEVRLGDLSVEALPPGLTEDARRRIALIDVLWIRRNSYVAAFEIEATTSILSGLARMGDLIAMIPDLDVPLFIVAPEARREKVFDEMAAPVQSWSRAAARYALPFHLVRCPDGRP